jgi:hypothetical protein
MRFQTPSKKKNISIMILQFIQNHGEATNFQTPTPKKKELTQLINL